MPSSTSSSDRPGFVRQTASNRPGVAQPVPERDVPDRRWGAIMAGAFGLARVTSSSIAVAAGLAAGILMLVGWMWLARCEEKAADIFAYELNGDLAGMAELMSVYPQPTGSLLRRSLAGLFATHPEPVDRLEAISRRAEVRP